MYLHAIWRSDEPPVHTVLDVGCGTGLLAAELVAHGYRVTGVDASQPMLDRARRLLGPDPVLLCQILPDLTVEGTFDAAVSTFDALNYLTTDELRASLSAIADRLRPRGWLVFDLHTDAMMTFTAEHPVVSGETDGNAFEISSVVDLEARTCETRIELTGVTDAEAFTEIHRQYFHSDAQVRDALSAAGFELVTHTDEYSERPVDASTLRATWITQLASADI
jgi:predicted TPR repeat methyltransferase